MRSKHPPLPTRVRLAYRALRGFGLLLALVGVTLAVVCAVNGLWLAAAWSGGAGIAFAILTWIPPTSRWLFPLMASLAVGISFFLQHWVISAFIFATLAWAAWSRTRVGKLPTEVEVAPPDAVMKNADDFVHAFQGLGFEQVGAYRAKIGRVPIVASILLSPDAASYASVTDAVLNVTSLFPDGRRLLTRNHNVVGLPPEMLINPISGASPHELVSAHSAALAALAEHAEVPLPLASTDLPQIAIDSELRTIEWMKGMSRLPRSGDKTPLMGRPDLAERIAVWQAS